MDEQQISNFIQSQREKKIPDAEIHSFLVDKGVIEAPEAQPETNENLGTGFDPTFESREGDSLGQSIGKGVMNIPKSAASNAKDVVTAVTNPVQTTRTVGEIITGGAKKLGDVIEEKAPDWLKDIELKGDSSESTGLPSREETSTETFDAVVDYYGARYGSLEELKQSLVEDPVGVALDVAAIFTGGGAIAGKVGTASKIGAVEKAGATAAKIGRAVDPVNIATKTVGKVGDAAGRLLGDKVKMSNKQAHLMTEITGKKPAEIQKIIDSANDGTPGAPKDLAEWMTKNNILGNSKEAVIKNSNAFREQRLKDVDTIIKEVDGQDVSRVYDPELAPQAISLLENISEALVDVKSSKFVGISDEVNSIISKLEDGTATLGDLQRAKVLNDKLLGSKQFKKGGEAKANQFDHVELRSELQKMIEEEAIRINPERGNIIKQYNKDVQITHKLEDSIDPLKGIGSTGDMSVKLMTSTGLASILGASAFGIQGALVAGVGILGARQILSMPAVRSRIIKKTNRLTPDEVKSVTEALETGKTTGKSVDLMKTILNEVFDEVKDNKQYLQLLEDLNDQSDPDNEDN